MRINVYAEELTQRTELVTKQPDNHPGTTFYGVRFYLASPDVLHVTPDDDDSSAVTLWVPWTRAEGHDVEVVRDLLLLLVDRLDDINEGSK